MDRISVISCFDDVSQIETGVNEVVFVFMAFKELNRTIMVSELFLLGIGIMNSVEVISTA